MPDRQAVAQARAVNIALIEAVRNGWGCCGIEPDEVIEVNDFGNLILKDALGRYWRLSPEDLSCNLVAHGREELDELSRDQAFLRDWHMSALRDQAYERLGICQMGRKYASR